MKLRSVEVRDFGAIESASVEFGDGLNVLYGPNDLGKSTLAAAIRAALLLQHGSSAARPYVPWGSPRKPSVELSFELEGRLWRVSKAFGSSSGGKSVLEWSNDGSTFTTQEEGRGVDGKLRELLGWGLAAPGGRGGTHGFPKSFLATVLLGEQALPYRVFEQSLDDDPEDSGKARLVEALQALAADPLYQHVLEAAQARVDEAFTAKGKRSTRKGSPFERVAIDIRQRREASEGLAQQLSDSDAVVSRLAELAARRDQRMAARAEVLERHEALLEAVELQRQRALLQAEVDEAETALREIERNRDEMDRLRAASSEARAQVPICESAVETAAQELRDAHARRDRAEAASKTLRAGGDEQGDLEQQQLASRTRELEAARAEVDRERQSLQRWRAADEAMGAAAEALERARSTAASHEQERDRAQRAATDAETRHAELQDAQRWAELESLRERRAQWQRARSQAEERRARAEVQRQEAEALELSTTQRGLPDTEACAALREVWDELRLSKAALGGGLTMTLAMPASTVPRVGVDGAAWESVGADAVVDAQAELAVEFPDLGRLTVVAGDPAARRRAESALSRWRAEGEPVLQGLELDSLDALEKAVAERDEARARVAELRREARALDDGAPDPSPDEGAALDRSIAGIETSLADVDSGRLAELVAQHTDGLSSLCTDAEAEVRAQQRSSEAARSAWTAAHTEVRVATERHLGAVRDERAARIREEVPLATVAEELQARDRALGAELDQVRAELAIAGQRHAQRLAAAEETEQAAAAAVSKAQSAETEARSSLARAHQAVTSATAQLEVRREQAQHHDPLAVAERVARAQDALRQHPAPAVAVDEEQQQASHGQLQQATVELEEAETAVRQQEGALQHVGGQVVRERAQMAREALDEAHRRESEVALDYDGWRLLLQTLRTVENETGAHLGRALGSTVATRFAELSAGRYQGAALGADLETEGVVTPQGVQRLDRFSEGVKEQLATLMRVSVAEQLGTMLLLDDHLAQTDPQRAQWFRHQLQHSAEQIQIVVLTCRPDDYLVDGSSGAVHAIDLAKSVQRR